MGSIMGSVSMQSQASSRGERLSAFVDGELFGEEHLNKFISGLDHEDRASWSHYHLIGDVMRSDDLAVSPAASSAFLAGFAARLEQEPHVLAPAALPVAAAAATLTWIVVPQLQGVPGGAGVSQVASIQSHGDAMQRVAMASVQVVAAAQPVQDGNMIRDASLDQYLEAHRQFAHQPVMPGSMPLIRTS